MLNLEVGKIYLPELMDSSAGIGKLIGCFQEPISRGSNEAMPF
jgi:hypothetical protein